MKNPNLRSILDWLRSYTEDRHLDFGYSLCTKLELYKGMSEELCLLSEYGSFSYTRSIVEEGLSSTANRLFLEALIKQSKKQ